MRLDFGIGIGAQQTVAKALGARAEPEIDRYKQRSNQGEPKRKNNNRSQHKRKPGNRPAERKCSHPLD